MGFSVQTDLSQRLLSVIYSEIVGIEQARCCFEQVQIGLDEMQPGFRFLTDLTELDSMDTSCALYVQQMMSLCEERGVALIVRIIPDPQKDIGFNIMSRFHYTGEVLIVTCANREEAALALTD